MFHNGWTHSHFIHTVHCDNTKPVYIQNYVGVYLALGQEREREREGGGERGGEEVREREAENYRETEKRCLCERDRGGELTVRKTTEG